MSALALRNPNRNTAMRVMVPILITLLILGILSTPVIANEVLKWIAKIANALGLASSLRGELERLKTETIPDLKAKVPAAEENTLKWGSAYTNATDKVAERKNLLADQRGQIKTLGNEISNLDRVITSNQSTIDWVDAWFRDNDAAFKPSEARKLQEDRTAAINARDSAKADKQSKETSKKNLENKLPRTNASIDEAERVANYAKLRWDSAKAAEKALKDKIKAKEARASALPGLIKAQEEAAAKAEERKKAAEQRLRDQDNGNDDD